MSGNETDGEEVAAGREGTKSVLATSLHVAVNLCINKLRVVAKHSSKNIEILSAGHYAEEIWMAFVVDDAKLMKLPLCTAERAFAALAGHRYADRNSGRNSAREVGMGKIFQGF